VRARNTIPISTLHVGELGDATYELFRRLGRDTARPDRQVVLTTKERRDMADFPLPAYELIPLDRYFLGSISFQRLSLSVRVLRHSGLYGRNPR
jgi:hypothetical protein